MLFRSEKGAFSQIPMRWNNNTGTLTLGERTGAYEGMLQERTFKVVLVSKAHPASFSPTPAVARSVKYTGAEVRLKLQ